jgi:hypothetical protein
MVFLCCCIYIFEVHRGFLMVLRFGPFSNSITSLRPFNGTDFSELVIFDLDMSFSFWACSVIPLSVF